MIRLRHGAFEVSVAFLGAELQSFAWRGQDLLWHGDPAWWGRRAPVLFPIVGRLAGDTLRHRGQAYRMAQHGFARDLPWELLESGEHHALLRLRDSEATHACYPFVFTLEQRFELSDEGLRITLTLSNPSPETLPASLGLHPAFRWPLPDARGAHRLRFERDEPAPTRRLRNGLLAPEGEASPIEGRSLRLEHGLFERDALIFDALESRGLIYGAEGAPSLRLAWDFPHFGIWTKPGAPFLCLEPWQGFADPEGFAGEFTEKPGLALLAPGAAQSWFLSIGVGEASKGLS